MDTDSFGFILEYQDRNIYCEVFCDEGHYMVIFDGQYCCEVELNDQAEWVQADGNNLSEFIIREIGLTIEAKLL